MINIFYIYPSIMTYSIQVITGIVIVLGGSVGIYIKKLKKKMKIKSKKEVESDNIIVK